MDYEGGVTLEGLRELAAFPAGPGEEVMSEVRCEGFLVGFLVFLARTGSEKWEGPAYCGDATHNGQARPYQLPLQLSPRFLRKRKKKNLP